MTEQQWLACDDPAAMLFFLNEKVNDRRYRLFVVACCRRIWNLLPDEASRQAVEVGDRYSNGLATDQQLREAATTVFERDPTAAKDTVFYAVATTQAYVFAASTAAGRAAQAVAESKGNVADVEAIRGEQAAQCCLLREIFGNPFRATVIDPSWLSWNNGTVMGLVRTMDYERIMRKTDRWFEVLPILADALEEAGCRDEELLAHCRQPGEHVHGCWAIDLLLAAVHAAERTPEARAAMRDFLTEGTLEVGKMVLESSGKFLARIKEIEEQRKTERQRKIVWGLLVILFLLIVGVFLCIQSR